MGQLRPERGENPEPTMLPMTIAGVGRAAHSKLLHVLTIA